MANRTETNINLKLNRVPDEAVLEDMVANHQILPNQFYMLPSVRGDGLVALQTKTLWTNPSPDSSFAGQTVSNLVLNKYDYIMFYFKTYYGTTSSYCQLFKNITSSRNFLNVSYYAGNSLVSVRGFTINSNNIVLEDAYNNGSISNDNVIPTQIIGIKLVNSQSEVKNEYSTDEMVVGRWIDGKPIYRKIFTYTETTSTSGNNLPITSSLANLNIDLVVKIDGVVKRNSGSAVAVNSYENSTYFHSLKYAAGNENVLYVNYSNYYGEVYAILEYTKTTD